MSSFSHNGEGQGECGGGEKGAKGRNRGWKAGEGHLDHPLAFLQQARVLKQHTPWVVETNKKKGERGKEWFRMGTMRISMLSHGMVKKKAHLLQTYGWYSMMLRRWHQLRPQQTLCQLPAVLLGH